MNRSLLFLTVLVIATCGLIYELIVGTLASYLLGDSITQFSTVIGVYLFALGIGAWLSGFIDKGVATRFVEIELDEKKNKAGNGAKGRAPSRRAWARRGRREWDGRARGGDERHHRADPATGGARGSDETMPQPASGRVG